MRTEVYTRKGFDRFGHTIYGELLDLNPGRFMKWIVRESERFDIIHLHELDKLFRAFEKRHMDKPVVMHYHGSDIRNRWSARRTYWKHAAQIVVSTPNLLEGAPDTATYLPNPVDTDRFYPNPNRHEAPPDSALTFSHGAVDTAKRLAEEKGLTLSILPRNKQFLEMPDLFRKFSWYIDTKRSNTGRLLCRKGDSGSLTGLEASACGLKVINSDGEIRDGLLPQHRAENVVKQLHQIYMSLIEPS